MDFLTVEEVAQELKIGRTTAYKLVNTEGFPFLKIGRSVRIPKEQFSQWVNNNYRKKFEI